jgi:hypothetical protein
MTTNKTIEQQLQDLEALPEADLLAIPDENLTPETLVEIWTRSSEIKEKKAADQAVEQRAARAQRDAQQQEKREQAERLEQAQERFEITMRDVQERSEQLDEDIERQEALDRERLRDIDERTMTLKDGRKIYVGEKGDYMDDQGHTLQGADAGEAKALHEQNPHAATWAEKSDAENQYEATRQLHEKVAKLRDDAGKESGQGLSPEELKARGEDYNKRLTGYEKEFQDQVQNRSAALSAQGPVTDDTYGGSDYMAAYGGPTSTTSFASTSDPHANNGALTKGFQQAALPAPAGNQTPLQQTPGLSARAPTAAP